MQTGQSHYWIYPQDKNIEYKLGDTKPQTDKKPKRYNRMLSFTMPIKQRKNLLSNSSINGTKTATTNKLDR